MQRSEKPHEELDRAAAAVEVMRRAKSFAEFEEHWREFLRRLDRVWNKTEAHYSRSPKWHSWRGKFASLRSKDELLVYLAQARGADEHSVGEVVGHLPGSLAIKAGPSGSVHFRRLAVDAGRVEMEVQGEPPIVEVTPARPKLLPITNRGRTYDPPKVHRGANIDPNDVLRTAQTGLEFYKEFVVQAEQFFVK